MSRTLAYLGPAARVGGVVAAGAPAWSDQAAALPHAGVAWYPEDGTQTPVRLLDDTALAHAPHHRALLDRMTSRCVVAAAGRPVDGPTHIAACQPFAHGRMTFVHDGQLAPFREAFERPLRQRLNDGPYRSLRAGNAHELLFATWLDILGDRTDADAMADAADKLVARVRQIANAKGAMATFAVTVSNGQSLIVLRTATHGTPPRLFTTVARDGDPLPATGRLVCTEPTFDGDWTEIEAHSLTIFTVE